ncbi:hypothetical protein B0H19DRAFT_1081624 [Mycena capillaripes]|nr:hypothetical protein B0H19DRAFT_1081624 [Mycena capillaripes]
MPPPSWHLRCFPGARIQTSTSNGKDAGMPALDGGVGTMTFVAVQLEDRASMGGREEGMQIRMRGFVCRLYSPLRRQPACMGAHVEVNGWLEGVPSWRELLQSCPNLSVLWELKMEVVQQ